MLLSAQLAGFFAAHGLWSVADGGGPLIPMIASHMPDGSRKMTRLVMENLKDAAAMGEKELAENPAGAKCSVMVIDGYITLDAGKYDALLVHAQSYEAPKLKFVMAVPYKGANETFKVYRPKIVSIEGDASFANQIGDAFFSGVDSHEQGAKIWNKHLDQSL